MLCLLSSVEPHFERLKSNGLIKNECTFLSTPPDQTRFLWMELKRRQSNLGHKERKVFFSSHFSFDENVSA